MVLSGRKGSPASTGAPAGHIRVTEWGLPVPGPGPRSSASHQAGHPLVSLSLKPPLLWPFIKPGAQSQAARACTWGGPGWAPECDTPSEALLLFIPARLLHRAAVAKELRTQEGLYTWDTLAAPASPRSDHGQAHLTPEAVLTPHTCRGHTQLGN